MRCDEAMDAYIRLGRLAFEEKEVDGRIVVTPSGRDRAGFRKELERLVAERLGAKDATMRVARSRASCRVSCPNHVYMALSDSASQRPLSESFQRTTLPLSHTSSAHTSHRVARHRQLHMGMPGRLLTLYLQRRLLHRHSNHSKSYTNDPCTNSRSRANPGSVTQPSLRFKSSRDLMMAPALPFYSAWALDC
jgi:hypothetical protein